MAGGRCAAAVTAMAATPTGVTGVPTGLHNIGADAVPDGAQVAAAAAAATAAAATAATATAAPLSTVAVIPFPSPPRGAPRVGRFHALPSLQCRLHPAAAGGAFPDPDAVAAPGGAPDTGWWLRANDISDPVFIPYAPGACASPVEDAREFEALGAPAELAREWLPPVGTEALPPAADVDAEYGWAGNALYADATSIAIRRGPVGAAEVRSEWFRPQPCGVSAGDPPGGAGLVCEANFTRLLTLQRNHWYSLLRRERGVCDVLAVTHVTSGVALDGKAHLVAALDSPSAAAAPRTGTRIGVVTYTSRHGVTGPVLVGETALLSLGRGVLADPSWLGAAFPGGPATGVVLDRVPQKDKLSWSLRDPHAATTNSSQ